MTVCDVSFELHNSLIKIEVLRYRLIPKLNKKFAFSADISATPFGLNSLGGLAGLESLGLGQQTFMDIQVCRIAQLDPSCVYM